MSSVSDADEIVRLYDGAENPIGLCYDRDEFAQLLEPFEWDDFYFHFFPARAVPVPLPAPLHKLLDRKLPFMIYANVRKPE